jgi:hypothetical protein
MVDEFSLRFEVSRVKTSSTRLAGTWILSSSPTANAKRFVVKNPSKRLRVFSGLPDS